MLLYNVLGLPCEVDSAEKEKAFRERTWAFGRNAEDESRPRIGKAGICNQFATKLYSVLSILWLVLKELGGNCPLREEVA